MKIHEYNEMMAYLTRPARVGFSDGPPGEIIITKPKSKFYAPKAAETKKLKATKKLKDFVKKFKLENDGKLPTQKQIMDAVGGKSETIQKYLTEGVDYAPRLTKQQAAKLGGVKPTGITEVSSDLIDQFKNLKTTHISPTIETTAAGSKMLRVRISGPVANDFKIVTRPATLENLQEITNEIENVIKSDVYKKKARVFNTDAQKRKIKNLREAMYRKQDPYGIYKALQQYKTEKLPGIMSQKIVIQHGQPKFTTQTLSKWGLIPKEVNNMPVVKMTERIRNNNLKIAMSKLNNPNRSITDKKKIIEQFNDTMKGLRGQLKGTFAQGAVNFELLDIDAEGDVVKLKDIGFNPKKGLGYGSKLGDLDLSVITRQQADAIINLGKSKIDKLVKPANEVYKLLNSADGPTIAAIRNVLKCGGLANGGSLLECPMAKFAQDPEGTLNAVGRAVPETRTPIMNAFKKLGMGTLKWGGRAFIGLTPIFAGMEIKEQSRKFKEGVPAGQLVADLGEWVLPGVSGAYKAKQKSDMIKDIANPEELKILDKKAKYDSAKEMFDLGAIGWGEEERAAKEMAENQLTEEEELSLSNLEKSARDLETFKMERLSAERAARPLPEIDPWQAAEGGRAGFDGGGSPLQRLRQEIVDSMRPYAPGDVTEEQLQLIVKDITLDMTAEQAQASAKANFIKLFGMASGGRVGFKDGSPKDPKRRLFLKGITALAALPLVGKYFKLGKVLEKAQPYYGPTVEKIKGMPDWFPSLVKKLWNEGEDVTKQAAYGERQVVKRGTLEGGDEVDMIYQMDTGDVSIQVVPKKGEFSTKSGAYEKPYELDYKKGIGDETTKGTPPDEFSVTEARPFQVGKDDVDLDYDMVDIDDAMSDLQELENFAKKK